MLQKLGINMSEVNKKSLAYLFLFQVFIIALANWLVQFPVTVGSINFTWAMFIFPLTILATDLTVRLSNKYTARAVVGAAFIPAIIISIYLADVRIGIASGTAYIIGQLLDISVFQKLREKYSSWWVAPLVSTVAANVIDTYLFFGVAFHNSADEFMAANWFNIATTDLTFKMVVSLFIFLPIYGVVLNYLLAKFKSFK